MDRVTSRINHPSGFLRTHIHFHHGIPQSVNNYLALDGFQQMGWEIVPYTDAEPVRDNAPDEVVVGHIAAVRGSLRALGLPVPAELGYPDVLRPFLGRRLWQSTINAVATDASQWPPTCPKRRPSFRSILA